MSAISIILYYAISLIAADPGLTFGGWSLMSVLPYCAGLSLLLVFAGTVAVKQNSFKARTDRQLALFCSALFLLNLAIALVYAKIVLPHGKPEGLLFACFLAASFSATPIARIVMNSTMAQKAATAEERKQFLKMQFSPHFLFNNLNILTALIQTNSADAEEFTIKLARIYRYVLANMERDVVDIHESLEFTFDYISLLDLRYPDQIELHVEQPLISMSAGAVPSLALPVLMENMAKHNLPVEDGKIVIRIFLKDNCVVVRNTLNSVADEEERMSFGIGSNSLCESYRLRGYRVPAFRKTKEYYEVQLPIIHTDEAHTDNRR